MKKTFQISLALVGTLLFSCNQAEDLQLPVEENTPDSKIQWAIDLAQSEAERLFPPQGRADVRVAKVSGLKAVCDNNSRGESDTLIYVVNYDDNKGFALISATGAEQPVLAVVPEGSYDPAVGTDNPGFNLFMAAAKENAQESSNKQGVVNKKRIRRDTTVITKYGPAQRVKYCHKWGPGDVFGKYCTNGDAGCAVVAAASIISYLHRADTTRFYYTYPKADVSYEDIIWGELRRHQSSAATYHDGTTIEHTCWAQDKEAIHKAIGRVCRQFGYDADAIYHYTPRMTEVTLSKVPALFRKYLPDFTVSEPATFVAFRTMRCIDKGLIFLSGSLKNDPNSKHMWHTDGYYYTKMKISTYQIEETNTGELKVWEFLGSYYTEKMLNYMRWGWNGEYDGWYSGTEFNPTNSTDDPIVDIQYISIEEPVNQ